MPEMPTISKVLGAVGMLASFLHFCLMMEYRILRERDQEHAVPHTEHSWPSAVPA